MDSIEFCSAYSAITGRRVPGQYIPTVEHDDASDIRIEGGGQWQAITGHTGQYGYSGAIMHPSETADDDTIRQWVRDAGGDVFAIVPVESGCYGDDMCNHDEPDYCETNGCAHEPAGWAIIYLPSPCAAQGEHPRCSTECPWPMMMPVPTVDASPWAAPGDNHSADRITIYHGTPEPTIPCGYPETRRV